MFTMVSETHSGEVVRQYTDDGIASDIVDGYVARGFDIASVPSPYTVVLRSGRASVVVSRVACDDLPATDHLHCPEHGCVAYVCCVPN